MKTKTKILILEHDRIDLELIDHELQKSGIPYTSHIVSNEPDYVRALTHFIPDIILSDYTFPSFDGPTAFALRKQIAAETPFIFVSGTIGEERSIELIKNGVTDYCLKDNLVTLNHKIFRALNESALRRQKAQIEQKLMQSEKRLARAQQVAHIGHWEFNFATHELCCSDEICRIFGLPPDQNSQSLRSFISFIHPGDAAMVSEKLHNTIAEPADLSIHFRVLRKNGSIRYVNFDSKMELSPQGKSIGMYGIIHDVTQKTLLENILAAERTNKVKEITQAALTAQENERAEIERELHDNINQILGATKLFIELAKTDEERRELCLDKASGFIVNVIDQIRNISKRMTIPNRRLVGLFDSIRVLMNDLSIIRSLSVRFVADNLEESHLDEKLQLNIYRIIQEQLNNILKHSEATNTSVILNRDGDEVVLFVIDDGKGTDTSQKCEGVGIRNIMSRAALCQGLAEIHSSPGQGYQLKVTFPLNAGSTKPEITNRHIYV